MEYQVVNLKCDMKLMRPQGVLVIKCGKRANVSREEYQQLAQVYGSAVKGKVDVTYRITQPVAIEPVITEPITDLPPVSKKRKGKKR